MVAYKVPAELGEEEAELKKRQGSLERIRKLDFYAAPLAANAAAWRARCEELDGDARRVSSEQGRQS